MTSRAYTAEEMRDQFLEQVRSIAKYWAEQPNQTPQDRCDGVAFSILNIFDGTSMALPAFDIVARPHPDDKAYCMQEGTNYVQNGTVINDCYLHDMYYKK